MSLPRPAPDALCPQCERPYATHRETETGHCPACVVKVVQRPNFTEFQIDPLPYHLRPAIMREAQKVAAKQPKKGRR